MHIGVTEQKIENAVTGEIICTSKATYGTYPMSDQGFITGMGVTNFISPLYQSKYSSGHTVQCKHGPHRYNGSVSSPLFGW